jgi:hypothetical protein
MTDKTKGFSFKTENKNVLTEQNTAQKIDNAIKTTVNMGRKPKKPEEAIVKKVLLTLTQEEYEKFKSGFVVSGFPSESSFLKHLAKKNNII